MPRLLADPAPLRVSPAFRRMWLGLGVSNLGSQLTVVAVGLQVYSITGSTFAVGVLGIFALVPLVVLGLYGGALVDAFDRRKVALLASAALWIITGLILAQAALGLDNVWVLYVLVAIQSAAFAINNPARTAIIPRLVPARLLASANALQTLSMSIALTVGPLVGAFLVAASGFASAYAIDFVLFTVALWALWRLPPLPPVASTSTGTTPTPASAAPAAPVEVELELHDGAGGAASEADRPVVTAPAGPGRRVVGLSSVFEGLRYLGTRPNVRMTFLLDLAAMIFAMPRVVWPAVGVLYLGGGSTTTGWLNAAFAIGSVLASLLSGGLAHVHRQGRAVVVAVASFAVSTTAFGLLLVGIGRHSPDHLVLWGLLASGVALAAAGACDGVSAIFRQTILQTATPDEMRGRLQGVFIVVVAGGPRLGDVVTGANAGWLTEGWAVVVGGIACLVAVFVLVRWTPRFLAYDARHPEP